MSWGTSRVAVAQGPVAAQRRGGAWLWGLAIGWGLTLPVWVITLVVAANPGHLGLGCPEQDVSTGITPPCPAYDALVSQQLGTWTNAFVWVNVAGLALAVLVGFIGKRRNTRFMYGRGGLILACGLGLALLPLAGYGLGYGIGALTRLRRRRKVSPKQAPEGFATVADRLMRSGDVVPAIQSYTRTMTGREAGTVLGWTTDGADDLVTATPRGGVLVLGPPGSGKTSAVIIPTVMIAPGACVSSSIKSDVMNATASIRGRLGRCWHFDPGGDEVTPSGVTPARWSPLVSVTGWDAALQVGASMAAALTLNDKGSGNDAHLTGRATDWLQVLLYAAHLDGRAIEDVAEWAISAASATSQVEVMTILNGAEKGGDIGARIAARKFQGLISTPDKERGSTISTLVGMLRVYDSVSARELGRTTNFDPRAFVRSADTLYITARPDRQALYAPLLAALLEAIRLETYDRHKRIEAGVEPRLPHVTFALDEANTTAPIPLPAIISEAGGQGLHLAVGMQAIGPAVARWGDAALSFLTLFPVKVLFRGNFDTDTTKALSDAAGEFDREVIGYSQSTSYVKNVAVQTVNPSHSIQRQKLLTMGDITGIPEHRVLVWEGPTWRLLAIGMHWKAGVWTTATRQAITKSGQ